MGLLMVHIVEGAIVLLLAINAILAGISAWYGRDDLLLFLRVKAEVMAEDAERISRLLVLAHDEPYFRGDAIRAIRDGRTVEEVISDHLTPHG